MFVHCIMLFMDSFAFSIVPLAVLQTSIGISQLRVIFLMIGSRQKYSLCPLFG